MITKEDILSWINALQKIYNDNKEYLTKLDSAIGDADTELTWIGDLPLS